MTDKIMIDNIDVSGCEHYAGHLQEHIGTNKCDINGKCEREKNCYYKQLQREKQSSQDARDTAIKEFNRAEELSCLLKRKKEECEKLKEIEENAKIAFQVLWAETLTKTGWSPHIYAQNMLLKYFGGVEAFKEAKKKRKELLNKVCFKGEVADLFVTELEQELKEYKQKYVSLIDKKESLKERYEEILETLQIRNEQLQAEKEKVKELEKLRFPTKDNNYAVLTAKEFEKYNKYKQALEEIKEIIEPIYCDCHGECEVLDS